MANRTVGRTFGTADGKEYRAKHVPHPQRASFRLDKGPGSSLYDLTELPAASVALGGSMSKP
jgi:hypothetical protein